jgi:hypothetical protein
MLLFTLILSLFEWIIFTKSTHSTCNCKCKCKSKASDPEAAVPESSRDNNNGNKKCVKCRVCLNKCVKGVMKLLKIKWLEMLFCQGLAILAHFDMYTDFCFITIALVSDCPMYLWLPPLLLFILLTLPKIIAYCILWCSESYEDKKEHVKRRKIPYINSILEMKGVAFLWNFREELGLNKIKAVLICSLCKLFFEDIFQMVYLVNVKNYCKKSADGLFIVLL